MALEVDRSVQGEIQPADEDGQGYHCDPRSAEGRLAWRRPKAKSVQRDLGLPRRHSRRNRSGSLVERALEHPEGLCLRPRPGFHRRREIIADPRIVSGLGGEKIVHLRQHVHGIPIFRAVRSVRFSPEGEILDVVGDHISRISDDLDLIPALGPEDAVLHAARHLAAPAGDGSQGVAGLKVSKLRPRVLTVLDLPAAPALVRKPPFKTDIAVHLILFFDGEALVLGWQVPLFMEMPLLQYDLIVAASGKAAGEILYCRNGLAHTSAVATATRFNPSAQAPRNFNIPLPLADYPGVRLSRSLPAGFPFHWIEQQSSDGNNVTATARGRVVQGQVQQNRLTLAGLAASEDEQVVNAFFICNYLHDFSTFSVSTRHRGIFRKRICWRPERIPIRSRSASSAPVSPAMRSSEFSRTAGEFSSTSARSAAGTRPSTRKW